MTTPYQNDKLWNDGIACVPKKGADRGFSQAYAGGRGYNYLTHQFLRLSSN